MGCEAVVFCEDIQWKFRTYFNTSARTLSRRKYLPISAAESRTAFVSSENAIEGCSAFSFK